MHLKDRTFIITGAASGLGKACAERFVSAGAHVCLADIDESSGETLAARLGAHARFMKTDVTDGASVRRTVQLGVQWAIEAAAPLGGAVNCAGIVAGARVVGRQGAHDLDLFERVIRINLVGTFNVLCLAAEALSAVEPNGDGERGVIVNTASVSAFEGQIGQAAYSASKAGVAGMTLPIARELAALGIRVVAIAPGIFDTPLVAGLPTDVRASLGRQVPFPSRLGRPDEFAFLAQHIMENSMLNGEVIRLDGAIRMTAK